MKLTPLVCLFVLIICSSAIAIKLIKGFKVKDEEISTLSGVEYEKKYRHFQNEAQPTIINVLTSVDLFPEKNTYNIAATYIIKNKTNNPIDSFLVNFADDMEIREAHIIDRGKIHRVKDQYSVVKLERTLLPGDSIRFKTKFSYHWLPINGYQPFNAILQNGSFMRISRYYPILGYVKDNEIDNVEDRKRFNLGMETQPIGVDAPKNAADDFINLDMTISTSKEQTAIGVGELIKKWEQDNRTYFQYKTTSPIPFRFAISSAMYAVRTVLYKGRNVEIYYHPAHYENVEHLLKNIQLTLDYCETNFGPYPFKTIRFAEVSAFVKGFAATAYPATIYMTENMVFNANLGADKKTDVINELAGHELSHLWWGNNQVSPDSREGNTMLTETLAQYTELRLVKKMYGSKRVTEVVNMHLGIYMDERGFTTERPLYKMLPANTHISYSKGMVAMYQLTEMIGEEKVNLALKNFLHKHAYPNNKPVSTDLIHELYAVTDTALHVKIDDLFKKMTLYDLAVKNASVKKIGSQYELTIHATGNKYYEDGNGNKTKAVFNDSVEIAVYFMNRKERIVKLPIQNGQIPGKILLDEMPGSLLIDPNVKFIKYETCKPLNILNGL